MLECAAPKLKDVPTTHVFAAFLRKLSEIYPVFKSLEGSSIGVGVTQEDEWGQMILLALSGENGGLVVLTGRLIGDRRQGSANYSYSRMDKRRP